ncbi:hypothetical protein A3J32_01700 [Candidatus Saccharibacteria bacterium RIFCSPLOWO2_02_FULL_46_7]|nr:MAG: hypothetical protein A3J32_01700 [Candidatus Saccharibacteria bacterium RIFCSPLOWO2_02_FULL_46_7]
MAKKSSAAWLRFLKNSLVLLLVCAVLALLLLLPLQRWGKAAWGKTTPKLEPLAPLNLRYVDKNDDPLQLFKEPLISVTFDDGWSSIYTSAMPLLQLYGIRTTQYLLSGTNANPSYLGWEQIETIKKAGHELGCHSVDHPNLTALNSDNLLYQVRECKTTFNYRGYAVPNFASPYGASNKQTLAVIKQFYNSQRNTDADLTNGIDEHDINLAANFDRYNFISMAVRQSTTIEQIKQAVNYTIANKGWLVLTYHQVDEKDAEFGQNPVTLEKQLAYLSSTPVRIVTVGQALESLGVGQ